MANYGRPRTQQICTRSRAYRRVGARLFGPACYVVSVPCGQGFRGRIVIASWMSMQSIVSRERSHLHDAGERRPSLNTGVTGSLVGWPGGRSRRRAHATTPSWRTAGEGSPVVAAFRAVAASGWLWAQAPERSAASPAPRAGLRPLPEQRCPGQRGDVARVHQVIQNAAARCAGLRAGAAPALTGRGAARIPSPCSCW